MEPTVDDDAVYALAAGKVLQQHRERGGMSQRGLARAAGVSQSTLSRVERGKGVADLVFLRRVAGALGCAAGDLVGDIDETWLRMGRAAEELGGVEVDPAQTPEDPSGSGRGRWARAGAALGVTALGGLAAMAAAALLAERDRRGG